MSRLSIDVTNEEHKRLKAMAALQGKSIKDFVLERTLRMDESEESALQELESLLDARVRKAKAGAISKRSVGDIFAEVIRER